MHEAIPTTVRAFKAAKPLRRTLPQPQPSSSPPRITQRTSHQASLQLQKSNLASTTAAIISKSFPRYLEIPRKIASANRLVPLHIGLKSLAIQTSLEPTFTVTSAPRMNGGADGKSLDVFNRRWNTRTDSLWWSAISFLSTAKNRTVRSHAARRVRVAWVESLRKRGYAPDGSVLPGFHNQKPLKGTVQLSPKPAMLTTSSQEVASETDRALARFMELQGLQGFKYKKPKKSQGLKST